MAVEIPVPSIPYSEVNVTLAGVSYDIVFRESTREQDESGSGRLYFDIYTEDSLVKAGVKVMENQSLLARYLLDGFLTGDILCLSKVENNTTIATLANVGLNKSYGLFYLTNEELGLV
tara:strand:- start:861 stop:1214 length:354 start_codon:yes stop_codon:yes gene_type:complete